MLSVLLRFADSDYLFGIFKLLFEAYIIDYEYLARQLRYQGRYLIYVRNGETQKFPEYKCNVKNIIPLISRYSGFTTMQILIGVLIVLSLYIHFDHFKKSITT